MHVAAPSWLPEAYASPINITDTGYVTRNLGSANRVRLFIELFSNPRGRFLDYGAGFGLFVRLMRDAGYDFRWADSYCQNLFARGFEGKTDDPYDVVTAFEVFEHVEDPLREFSALRDRAQAIVFSTLLIPAGPTPLPGEWDYYGLEHGQHISFYTRQSLEVLGRKLGFPYFASHERYFHVFSRSPITDQQLRRVGSDWTKRIMARTRRRASLASPDYHALKAKQCAAQLVSR